VRFRDDGAAAPTFSGYEQHKISKREQRKRRSEVRNSSFQKFFVVMLTLAAGGFCGQAAAQGPQVVVNTGNPDGKLGALSRPPSANKVETETADDFFLSQTTVLSGATITGLLTNGATLANLANVEVEIYHVFPLDSDQQRIPEVPSRTNSPSDHEIGFATRAANNGTLHARGSILENSLTVLESVVNNINKKPLNLTHGEGAVTGQEVEIAITFTTPIALGPGRYFFRPQVLVNNGDFLFLSAPKPIKAPGLDIPGDLQAWIRNAGLSPDWLRIGTDIIGTDVPGTAAPVFNMAFTLSGITIRNAGSPGEPDCNGQTSAALNQQFGNHAAASLALGYPSVQALTASFRNACKE
jgi:hypothetical protein